MKHKFSRGDTIIEALVAFSIFSIISISSIAVMNQGIRHSQNSIEITMARNEIDAQAEALRFIHNSYASDRDYGISGQEYSKLWQSIEANQDVEPLPLNYEDCADAIKSVRRQKNTFVVNTRILSSNNSSNKPDDLVLDVKNKIIPLYNSDEKTFGTTPTYPRIIYSQNSASALEDSDKKLIENQSNSDKDVMPPPFDLVKRVEGIWVQGVPQYSNAGTSKKEPEFFDFHIRACWNTAGSRRPSTIGTVLRLYNPRYAEKGASHV